MKRGTPDTPSPPKLITIIDSSVVDVAESQAPILATIAVKNTTNGVAATSPPTVSMPIPQTSVLAPAVPTIPGPALITGLTLPVTLPSNPENPPNVRLDDTKYQQVAAVLSQIDPNYIALYTIKNIFVSRPELQEKFIPSTHIEATRQIVARRPVVQVFIGVEIKKPNNGTPIHHWSKFDHVTSDSFGHGQGLCSLATFLVRHWFGQRGMPELPPTGLLYVEQIIIYDKILQVIPAITPLPPSRVCVELARPLIYYHDQLGNNPTVFIIRFEKHLVEKPGSTPGMVHYDFV